MQDRGDPPWVAERQRPRAGCQVEAVDRAIGPGGIELTAGQGEGRCLGRRGPLMRSSQDPRAYAGRAGLTRAQVSEPPTAVTVSLPSRDIDSLAVVVFAGRPTGATTTYAAHWPVKSVAAQSPPIPAVYPPIVYVERRLLLGLGVAARTGTPHGQRMPDRTSSRTPAFGREAKEKVTGSTRRCVIVHRSRLVTGVPQPDPADVGGRATLRLQRLRGQRGRARVPQHPGLVADAADRDHVRQTRGAVAAIDEAHRIDRVRGRWRYRCSARVGEQVRAW